MGKKFQVRKDQHSLKHLLEQPIATSTQQNLVNKLLGYDFEIFYKLGKTNCAVDALSCKTKNMELAVVSIPHWLDPELRHIIQTIQSIGTNHGNFPLIARRLYHKGRIALHVSSLWTTKLMKEFHSTPSRAMRGP